jgi:hypothetical protein
MVFSWSTCISNSHGAVAGMVQGTPQKRVQTVRRVGRVSRMQASVGRACPWGRRDAQHAALKRDQKFIYNAFEKIE